MGATSATLLVHRVEIQPDVSQVTEEKEPHIGRKGDMFVESQIDYMSPYDKHHLWVCSHIRLFTSGRKHTIVSTTVSESV